MPAFISEPMFKHIKKICLSHILRSFQFRMFWRNRYVHRPCLLFRKTEGENSLTCCNDAFNSQLTKSETWIGRGSLPTIMTEPATSIISSSALQSISGDSALEKIVSEESVLDELRNLSRDLRAIRLQMDSHFRGSKKSQDWQMIGTVIDRLLFGLYIIFMTVTFITIICIWTWNNASVAWHYVLKICPLWCHQEPKHPSYSLVAAPPAGAPVVFIETCGRYNRTV